MIFSMTTKTTKAYALFAMVPLLLAGFGGNAFAVPQSTSYSADAVDDALNALNPYVTVNDNQIAKIDVSKAKANGVSKEAIKIGQEYLKFQNKMIQDIHDDPTKKMKVSEEGKEKFRKYFDKVKTVGLKDRTIKTGFLDYVIPLAYASHGCNYNGPHPQPTVTETGSYTDRTAAINALSSGYNQVPDYASSNEPDDFADWIIAYNCFDGIFRYQTIVFDDGSDWKHSNQHSPGEPNPEVLAYTWPVWWWAFYVEGWHNP